MLSLNFKYIQNLGFNESLFSSQGLKELFEESRQEEGAQQKAV